MMATSRVSIEKMRDYDFYHIIELQPGISTPGYEWLLPIQAPIHEALATIDVGGKRVLDVGCRDGLFSFLMERQGAAEIIGIDNDISPGAKEFLIPWFNSKVRMVNENIYNISKEVYGQFDVVLFAGVLYHLRFPYLAIRKLADVMKPGGVLVIETGLLLNFADFPMLYCPEPEDSPFDPTSVTFFNHLGMVAALRSFGFTDIRCTNVSVFGENIERYGSWPAFLESVHAASVLSVAKPVVGRGTYVSTFEGGTSSEADSDLRDYWYGDHKLNSDTERAKRFLSAFRERR